MIAPGHESGHLDPPGDLAWDGYVGHFKDELGGWAALADALLSRAQGVVEIPPDPGSIEKGLRRLAKRGHKPGGDYGRWMLRFFGVPPDAERWAKWIAQYHTRFADLPSTLQLAHLRQWDRPPVTESRLAAWIDVGLASVMNRLGDVDGCLKRLASAEASAERAGAAARIEVMSFRAFFLTNEGRRDEADARLDECEALLDSIEGGEERACYRARILVQRAYHLTKPVAGESADLVGAVRLFEAIELDEEIPFVCYRRTAGLAYCHWRLGDPARGLELAYEAARHAGDGGLVRFRVMALNLVARIAEGEESDRARRRAERLARRLEDEQLAWRVRRR